MSIHSRIFGILRPLALHVIPNGRHRFGPEERGLLLPRGVLEGDVEGVRPGLQALVVEHHDDVEDVEEEQEDGLVPAGRGASEIR